MAAADTLLIDLAGLLKSYEHTGICAYRLNGDEFALVLTHVPDRAQIAATIGQILSVSADRGTWKGSPCLSQSVLESPSIPIMVKT